MVSHFLIRKALVADRPAVLTIAAAGMREFGLEPDFAGLDADLGRLGEDRSGVVAEVNATICGSVLLSVQAGGVGKLTGFYVNSTYRGHGIGRALLQAAVAAGRDFGLAHLYVETWGRMSAAVRLYESAGWVRGEDPPAKRGADRCYWLELDQRPTGPCT